MGRPASGRWVGEDFADFRAQPGLIFPPILGIGKNIAAEPNLPRRLFFITR
jgi:hypothetical protein